MNDDTTYRIRLYQNRNGRNEQVEKYHEVVGWENLNAEVEDIFRRAKAERVVIYTEGEYRDSMDNKYTVWKQHEERLWHDPLAEAKHNLEGQIRWLAHEEERVAEYKARIVVTEAEIARLEALDTDPRYVEARSLLAEKKKRYR